MKYNYMVPNDERNDMCNAITMLEIEQEYDYVDRSVEIDLIKAYLTCYDNDWD